MPPSSPRICDTHLRHASATRICDTHLREVSQDKHLEVEFSDRVPPERTAGELPVEERERRSASARSVNHGFDKVERLDGNVGYLGLRTFAPVGEATDKAAAAMGLLADTEALIVDLRYNRARATTAAVIRSWCSSCAVT